MDLYPVYPLSAFLRLISHSAMARYGRIQRDELDWTDQEIIKESE